MNVVLLEPYFTGSHRDWAEGLARHSRHNIRILSLSGHYWKWRMHGGAITLARMFLTSDVPVDLVLATDMLDLTTFLALTREKSAHVPVALYFHENQLTYPWSPLDRDVQQNRDRHYAFINFASALAADVVFFNSDFHRRSFLEALPKFLRHFPDYRELESVDLLHKKSEVLPLGLDLARFDRMRLQHQIKRQATPLILWNHRWEYDKNPEEFFRALAVLAGEGVEFEVAVLGESFSVRPEVFLRARRELGPRVVQFGYAQTFPEYAAWLWRAHVLPVTSYQDFFGASVLEAVYCGCWPLLPRRLAYPELIPRDLHDTCFYDDFDDLVAKLRHAIQQAPPPAEVLDALRRHAQTFDWHEQAARYDAALEKVRRREYTDQT